VFVRLPEKRYRLPSEVLRKSLSSWSSAFAWVWMSEGVALKAPDGSSSPNFWAMLSMV